MNCPFCRDSRWVPDPNDEHNLIPCPDCASPETPSLGSLLLLGLVLLAALTLAFCAGERSGYAQGHFDGMNDAQYTDQALYGHGGYEVAQ